MKSFTKFLTLGAMALGLLGGTAFAGNPAQFFTPGLRCPSCGAPLVMNAKPAKNNTVEIKLEKAGVPGNPKGR